MKLSVAASEKITPLQRAVVIIRHMLLLGLIPKLGCTERKAK